jgi:hypothetical protein
MAIDVEDEFRSVQIKYVELSRGRGDVAVDLVF